MHHIKECPICKAQTFQNLFTCEDYTVSHETFWIVSCTHCDFKITNPRPENDQLGKYYESQSYISHAAKATNIIDRIYLIARNFTLQKKIKLISKYVTKPSTVLDYGCGTGEFLNTCKTNGWHINGVEPSETARGKSAKLNDIKINESIDTVQTKHDVITLWHVLEHIPDLDEIIKKLSANLTENGTLFIAVPNYKSYDAQKYKEQWAAYDVPRHLWHFDKITMEKLLAKFSLSIRAIVPMKLDAYYVSMLSEKYKSGNSSSIVGLMKAFLNGAISNLKARKTGNYSSLIYIIKK
jgi:2-polyprenyl-3-methyl-5-hydroxy-6-metoxy-1,4-benzoquinol methylase